MQQYTFLVRLLTTFKSLVLILKWQPPLGHMASMVLQELAPVTCAYGVALRTFRVVAAGGQAGNASERILHGWLRHTHAHARRGRQVADRPEGIAHRAEALLVLRPSLGPKLRT